MGIWLILGFQKTSFLLVISYCISELNTSMIRRVSIRHEESRKEDNKNEENGLNERDEADAEEDAFGENGTSQDSEKDENESVDKDLEGHNLEVSKPLREDPDHHRKRGPDNQTLLRLLEQVFNRANEKNSKFNVLPLFDLNVACKKENFSFSWKQQFTSWCLSYF